MAKAEGKKEQGKKKDVAVDKKKKDVQKEKPVEKKTGKKKEVEKKTDTPKKKEGVTIADFVRKMREDGLDESTMLKKMIKFLEKKGEDADKSSAKRKLATYTKYLDKKEADKKAKNKKK